MRNIVGQVQRFLKNVSKQIFLLDKFLQKTLQGAMFLSKTIKCSGAILFKYSKEIVFGVIFFPLKTRIVHLSVK